MCIILYKPKRITMPALEIMEACFENNPNGAGFMYRDENKRIQIRKGFMKLEDLCAALDKEAESVNLKRTDVVIHFRISTTGSSIPENTHPFPISNRIGDLKALSISTDKALAHNGILRDYAEYHNEKTDMSDTMYFCKMLSGVNDRFIKTVISQHTIGSRFVFLSEKHTIMWGMDKCHDKVGKGLYFSNTTFRKTPKYVSQYTYYNNFGGASYDFDGNNVANQKLIDEKEAEWQERAKKWKEENDNQRKAEAIRNLCSTPNTANNTILLPQAWIKKQPPNTPKEYITDELGVWKRTPHPTREGEFYYKKLSEDEQLSRITAALFAMNKQCYRDFIIRYTDFNENESRLLRAKTPAERRDAIEYVHDQLESARKADARRYGGYRGRSKVTGVYNQESIDGKWWDD